MRTLEEAEQEMNGGQHARQPMAHSRLAALVKNGAQPSICLCSLLAGMIP